MRKKHENKNWIDSLLAEYEHGKKALENMKKELDPEIEMDQKDINVLDEMIKDMSYAMNWMHIGREPDSYGGIDKRSAYQRRVIYDMDLLPSLEIEPTERKLTENEKVMITEILLVLSPRERQCYLLHMAQGWSMGEISEELNIGKSSVQQFIQRAKKKVVCRTKDIQAHL
ncbi:sigma factor-like helix-turn-helix DNA-binding protein [Oceanobacillus iheyensis]|uniref:sigma factor-like helix-turn-helix DNA-binding protein n=1 Tax=Oceanobacillus iheyensis TaxID=182710 RepID=UPI0036257104